VPEGRHVVRVHFATTPPRVIGWLLASAGLVTLGALAIRERRAEPWHEVGHPSEETSNGCSR